MTCIFLLAALPRQSKSKFSATKSRHFNTFGHWRRRLRPGLCPDPEWKGQCHQNRYVLKDSSQSIPITHHQSTNAGRSHDRFCGGFLNVESNEAVNIPIYSEITSPIAWIEVRMTSLTITPVRTRTALLPQVVTTLRNDMLKAQLEGLRTRGSGMPLFSFFGGGISNNRINRNFVEVGSGMRLRFSQRDNCRSSSFF